MPVENRNRDEVISTEKSEYDKGFDAGYKSGREYYANDIALEIADVDKSIEILEKYSPGEQTAIDELKRTLEILKVIKIKADSKRFL